MEEEELQELIAERAFKEPSPPAQPVGESSMPDIIYVEKNQ